MRSRTSPLAAAAILLLSLAGCASSGGSTPAPTVTETTTVTATPTASTGPTTPAADGTCTVDQLTLSTVHDAEASGMSQYYFDIVFTNSSSSECTLEGYPGVSFVGDGDGTQIGDPAGQDASVAISTVSLAPGGTAVSHVHGTQPGAYDCSEVQADGLRVYPPHSYESAYVADALPACATAGVVLLQVTPVEAG